MFKAWDVKAALNTTFAGPGVLFAPHAEEWSKVIVEVGEAPVPMTFVAHQ